MTEDYYNWDNGAAVISTTNPSTLKIKAPVIVTSNPSVFAGLVLSFEGKERKSCGEVNSRGRLESVYFPFPKDGVLSMTKTDASKCQFGSNETIVRSATYIHFAVNLLSDFGNITASIFDDPTSLPLLQIMNTAIMLSIKPQAWDLVMATDLNQTLTPSVNPNDTTNILNFNICHLPNAPETKELLIFSFSAVHLHNVTTDTAHYLASLGHNVLVSKGTGAGTVTDRLYVLYDTIELKDAFKAPTGLIISLSIFVAFCLGLWIVSLVLYPSSFNGSLYKIVFEELKAKEDKTPMLMDNSDDPLAFEGQRVIPHQDN
ncbi:hypothetical protein BGW39_005101 [Mortierella sp. 14UC]|nr:hypothetical protein BGW39_005101 [Mortierella sp. 14UC]